MLASLLRQCPDALRADLRAHYGVRLNDMYVGSESVLDVADYAVSLPPTPASAVYRRLNPDWVWTLDAMLQAEQADSLRWMQWAKSKDGQRNRNRPKPIPRPGKRDDKAAKGKFSEAQSLPIDDFKRRLEAPRRAA